MRGVGPPSRAWEARVIAVIRHPQRRKENNIYRYGASISIVNINFLTMFKVEFPCIIMRHYYIASKNIKTTWRSCAKNNAGNRPFPRRGGSA